MADSKSKRRYEDLNRLSIEQLEELRSEERRVGKECM